MNDLLEWYHVASNDPAKHPIETAAELHYRFVRIHPFDDGNGRISRLLMNYHLLKHGFPPVIIKSTDKKNYLFALHEADTGNIKAFYSYVAEQLIWSYEISIKAARGEEVDEAGDWKKKVSVFQKKLNPEKKLHKKKSVETIHDTLINVAIPFLKFLLEDYKPVTDLFFNHSISVRILNVGSTSNLKEVNKFQIFFESLSDQTLTNINSIEIYYSLENFKQNGSNAFTLNYKISLILSEFSYIINMVGYPSVPHFQKLYHNIITEKDLEHFANHLTPLIIKNIENQIQTPLN
jgi:hypothetical protein